MAWVAATRERALQSAADAYAALAAFIIRAAFWTVFLVGLVDAVLSFLRVEDFLPRWWATSWPFSSDGPCSAGSTSTFR